MSQTRRNDSTDSVHDIHAPPSPKLGDDLSRSTNPKDERLAHCKCSTKGRNLVICIDGTSNKFGPKTTNVVQLYDHIAKIPNQLLYYSSGIGTYAKALSKTKLNALKRAASYGIDLVVAWNFGKIVMAAYRWLCENYQDNDRIYFFGFSRGAYQVRALAGMIHKVGLIHKGNERQIPFAYDIYADPTSEQHYSQGFHKRRHRAKLSERQPPINLAQRFKTAFSRENVRVHFVGVWDTVSSIGHIRGKVLPLTDTAGHICFFRHALALDECRVKFLPEYVLWTSPKERRRWETEERLLTSDDFEVKRRSPPAHIKEVWFRGKHSDIGGDNEGDFDRNLRKPPFLWMSHEAISSGLILSLNKIGWDPSEVSRDNNGYPMPLKWRAVEWYPFKVRSYESKVSTSRFPLHRGQGRKILDGQKIHASVGFSLLDQSSSSALEKDGNALPLPSKVPKAILPHLSMNDSVVAWETLTRSGLSWHKGGERQHIFEMNMFHPGLARDIVNGLSSALSQDIDMWLQRLEAFVWSYEGCEALTNGNETVRGLAELLTVEHPAIQLCVVRVLGELRERGFLTNRSPDVIRCLIRVVGEATDSRLQSIAAKVLSEFKLDLSSCDQLSGITTSNTFATLLEDENPETVRDSLRALRGLLKYDPIFERIRSSNTDVKDIKIEAVRFMTSVANKELPMNVLAHNAIEDVRKELNDSDKDFRAEVVRLLAVCASHDRLWQKIFDDDAFSTIRTKLNDKGMAVGTDDLQLLIVAAPYAASWPRLFDDTIISALAKRLMCGGWGARREALRVLSHVPQDSTVCERIYSDATIEAILSRLVDDDDNVRAQAMQVLAVAAQDEVIFKRIFNGTRGVASTTLRLLGGHNREPDKYWRVRQETLRLLTRAAEFRGEVQENVLSQVMGEAIRRRLDDEDEDVRAEAVRLLAAAASNDHRRIFDSLTILVVQRILNDVDDVVSEETVRLLLIMSEHPQAEDDIFKEVFNPTLTRALQSKFSDRHWPVGRATLEILKHRAQLHSKPPASRVSQRAVGVSEAMQWLVPPANNEDIWARLFNNNTVSAWTQRLNDSQWTLRRQALSLLKILANDGENIRALVFSESLIEAIRRMVADDDAGVRVEAVGWLAEDEHLRGLVLDDSTTRSITEGLHDAVWGITEKARTILSYESLRKRLFDDYTKIHIQKGLVGSRDEVSKAMGLLLVASKYGNLRKRVFDDLTIQALSAMVDSDVTIVRQRALRILRSLTSSENLRIRVFNDTTIYAIRDKIKDSDENVREEAVHLLAVAATDVHLRVKVFDHDTVRKVLTICCNEGSTNVRKEALKMLTLAAESCPHSFNDQTTISDIKRILGDSDKIVKWEAVQLLTIAAKTADLQSIVLDEDTNLTIQRQANHSDPLLRRKAMALLEIMAPYKHFSQLDFNEHIILAIPKNLRDDDSRVQRATLKMLTVAVASGNLLACVIQDDTMKAVLSNLNHQDENNRVETLRLLAVAAECRDLRPEIFNEKIIKAIQDSLEVSDKEVIVETMKLLKIAANTQEIQKRVLNDAMISTIRSQVVHSDALVRRKAIAMLKIVVQDKVFSGLIFDRQVISAIPSRLRDDFCRVRFATLNMMTVAVAFEDLQACLTQDDTMPAILSNLDNQDYDIRAEALQLLTLAANCQELHLWLCNPRTREEVINAIRTTLSDSVNHVRVDAVRFLRVAQQHANLSAQFSSVLEEIQRTPEDPDPDVRNEILTLCDLSGSTQSSVSTSDSDSDSESDYICDSEYLEESRLGAREPVHPDPWLDVNIYTPNIATSTFLA